MYSFFLSASTLHDSKSNSLQFTRRFSMLVWLYILIRFPYMWTFAYNQVQRKGILEKTCVVTFLLYTKMFIIMHPILWPHKVQKTYKCLWTFPNEYNRGLHCARIKVCTTRHLTKYILIMQTVRTTYRVKVLSVHFAIGMQQWCLRLIIGSFACSLCENQCAIESFCAFEVCRCFCRSQYKQPNFH